MDYGTNGNINIKWIMGPMGTSKKNGLWDQWEHQKKMKLWDLQENARFRKVGAAKNFVGPVGTL
jgi:hypothetical protein